MNHNKKIIGRISLTQNVNTFTNINSNSSSLKHKRAKSSTKLKASKQKATINFNLLSLITRTSKNISTQNCQINNLRQSRSLSPKYSLNRSYLPKKNTNKKTLVLDLDETLVHSGFIPFECPSDVIIQIDLENEIHDIHVLVRPYVKEFLEKMSSKYELVIFTASLSKYANPLLNIIDKKGYCPFRLFREHCTLINTAFVKDLRRLGRDLKDIIIVDNSPVAYALNQYNGFPIASWFNDRNDCELLKIIPILEFLSYVPDVREYIKKIVKDNKIQFDLVPSIISSYNKMLKKNSIPMSLRSKGHPNALSSPSVHNLFKSSSNMSSCITNIFNDKEKNKNKKVKKNLNITGVEFHMKREEKKLKTKSRGRQYDLVHNKEAETEINRLPSFPCNYENFSRMSTMRGNSSTKKIIYLVTKEKNFPISSENKKIQNMLKLSINQKPNRHKKNTLSMSQRVKSIF